MRDGAADKPEGRLESTRTQDDCIFALSYDEKYGYHVGTRFQVFAQAKSLELGKAMIAVVGMVNSSEVTTALRHVRTEFKRLEFATFDYPASKQWAIINGAINRLEGKKLRLSGRNNRKVEIWEAR